MLTHALAQLRVEMHYADELPLVAPHRAYVSHVRRRAGKKKGFWRFATERFFVLEELMRKLDAQTALHLESDNFIFFDLAATDTKLKRLYPSLAAPFLNDDLCVPGAFFIGDLTALEELNSHIAVRVHDEARRRRTWYRPFPRVRMGAAINDMNLLADFRKLYGDRKLGVLPMAPPEYEKDGKGTPGLPKAGSYSAGFAELGMMFDGSAIGQYLFGIDPAHHDATGSTGTINPLSFVRAPDFGYERFNLRVDRSTPTLTYAGRPVRLASLHNHAKVALFADKPQAGD